MVNQALVTIINSVLGSGKSTSKGNYAYQCPFCKHHKPKLEINFTENKEGVNPWHCWSCDKRGKKLAQLLKLLDTPKEKIAELKSYLKVDVHDITPTVTDKVHLPIEF